MYRGMKEDNAKRDNILKRMLATPPNPRTENHELLNKGDSFIVLKGKFRILGSPKKNKDGSITGALYRNPKDYKAKKAIEPSFTFRP